jgi:hypothetical protein
LITGGTPLRRNGITDQRRMKMKTLQVKQPTRLMQTNATSFAQGSKDKTCYCGGKTGHLSPECPDKNIIWNMNKAMQYYQEAIRLMIIKKKYKKQMAMKAIKAQQAKPHPELDGVA